MSFTDGQDGRSFLDEPKLLDVVARTDMTVFTVALTDGTTRVPRRPSNERMLQALADASGGALTVVQRDADLAASFVRKLEEFRTSYVLRYSPTGVPPGGWHDVEVRLSAAGRFRRPGSQGLLRRDRGRGPLSRRPPCQQHLCKSEAHTTLHPCGSDEFVPRTGQRACSKRLRTPRGTCGYDRRA